MRGALALVLMTSLAVATDAPADPAVPQQQTLADGRVRTWVPGAWAVTSTTSHEIYERWVPGHWDEPPAAPAAVPAPRPVTARSHRHPCPPPSRVVVAPWPGAVLITEDRWRPCWRASRVVVWPLWMGLRPACGHR